MIKGFLTQRKLTQKSTIVTAFTALILTAATLLSIHSSSASPALTVSSWWPKAGVTITDTQPFKGAVSDMDVGSYSMYWSVDGGQLNAMPSNYDGYPHKEANVNVASWQWHSDGKYSIAYIAKDSRGAEIARTSFSVTVPYTGKDKAPSTPSPSPASAGPAVTVPAPTAAVTAPVPAVAQAISFYVDPNATAKQQADAWRSSRPADAAQMDKVANQATAKWFGGWNSNLTSDVSAYVGAAAAKAATPVLVAYNIPQRDCGGYSSGGTTPDAYVSWIKAMAAGIGSRKALVIVEPDSVANLDCLSAPDQATRLSLLSQAVSILKANSGTSVYLDAGHPQWKSAADIAARLKQANIAAADGFTLNVSNFYRTSDNISFGKQVSAAVGGKHFVIDTSRNGAGPTGDNQWCNPGGRALGERPSLQTADPIVDAYLWIKAPGESDGNCSGGPSAGTWWADYALGLAQRAAY